MANVRNRVLAEKREEDGQWIMIRKPLPINQPIQANWCKTGTIKVTSSMIITSGSPDFQQRIQQYKWDAIDDPVINAILGDIAEIEQGN